MASTGRLPAGLTAGAEHYVRQVTSADTFKLVNSPLGEEIAVSGPQSANHSAAASNAVKLAKVVVITGAPAKISWTAHGLREGNRVSFATSGQLSAGISSNVEYVLKTVESDDTFTLSLPDGGPALVADGPQHGTHTAI